MGRSMYPVERYRRRSAPEDAAGSAVCMIFALIAAEVAPTNQEVPALVGAASAAIKAREDARRSLSRLAPLPGAHWLPSGVETREPA